MVYLLVAVLMVSLLLEEHAGALAQIPGRGAQATVEAQWVQLYGQAAQAYFVTHPQEASVGDAQLVFALGPWAPLLDSPGQVGVMSQVGLQHGALLENGQIYAWIRPSGAVSQEQVELLASALDSGAGLDRCLYAVEHGGVLNQLDGDTQPAPAGIPDGALVFRP